ncbi:zinc-binding dehydrogenase [Pseudonocardia sp. C8]|uniref:zinc-binding dehydrogenase n=1 Tax=Pseudonocardia sp. C8 TaxID=2762759 RepID=UPI0016427244|nr:zinc-binding dehydrogenase [Pseudonocardia sp. C8]MBC3193744.1 zinc-binding dehydrogenase [Pseudonocardia sp. C8]
MNAAVCTRGELTVREVPAPRPGPGQILLDVARAGICGSDLHARVHADHLADMSATVGYTDAPRSEDEVVFGHEICGEVVEYGAGTHRRWSPGSLVVAMPMIRNGRTPYILGTSKHVTGAYAEQIVVQESFTFDVPNGMPAQHAVLTEPMAVGWHAVRKSRITRKQTAYVIGCGPVGLAVIGMLKAAGVRTIIASDLSPARRDLAGRLGADVVVDPRTADPFESSPHPPKLSTIPEFLNLGFDAMEKLRRIPRTPWWLAFRAMHGLRLGDSRPVVFECVGVPGMIDSILGSAPLMSTVVVAGACLEPDTFHPSRAIGKEIDVLFSVGYDPGEFRDTLHMLADGTVDPSPLVTGTVGLHGVEAAFSALGDPERHAKILIDPRSDAVAP